MTTLTADELARVGLTVDPQELQRLVLEAVKRLPPAPRHQLPERELRPEDRAALLRGGFSLDPLPPGAGDPLARTVA